MIYSAYKDITPLKLNIAKLIIPNSNKQNLNISNKNMDTIPKQNDSKFINSTINQENNPPKKEKRKSKFYKNHSKKKALYLQKCVR